MYLCILFLSIGFFFVPELSGTNSTMNGNSTTNGTMNGTANGEPKGATLIERQFDVNKDVAAIKAATQVNKTDLRIIIDILTKRTVKQRLAIKKAYNATYGVALPGALQSITQGKLKFLLTRLLYSPVEYLARDIRFSLDFDQDWSYMSILCTTNAVQLKKIVDKFSQIFNKSIVDELFEKMKIQSGKEFLRNMIAAGDAGRPNSGIDDSKFEDQMSCIPHEGNKCSIYHNDNLFKLLTTFSFEHIKKFSQAFYDKENKKTGVFDRLSKYCGEGETKEGYLKIIRYAFDPVAYYAVELYDGLTSQRKTRDGADRVLILRSEIDLHDVEHAFFQIYKTTVNGVIDIIYGTHDIDYTNALKNIVNGN